MIAFFVSSYLMCMSYDEGFFMCLHKILFFDFNLLFLANLRIQK